MQAKSMSHQLVVSASHVFCKRCACYARYSSLAGPPKPALQAESESEPCPPCPVSPAGGAEGDTLTTAPPCSEGEGKKTEPEGAWSWPIPGMAHGTALAAARPALALLLVAASIHLA
ncbi:unnamed protein product [Prorocentrum cordatum]|uniref:Uncharacterized protein n=1 Tax=Prorocentrum cordatum TaxID=2364126 RepID=A0ABN9VSY6_9DINO|nr:unnamed protein product [Polarella glacialis]